MDEKLARDYEQQLEEYREKVKKEMITMGASKSDLYILETLSLHNAIKYKYDPKDVAWAILQ